MRNVLFALAVVISTASAQAQTWTELQALQTKTPVRVFEAARKGWTFADGKLLLVKDDELTILRGRRPLVIPKAVISKVESRRRDPPIEGAVIGALANVLLGSLGGWQGCTNTSECALAGIGAWAGLGALVDWRIVGRRTVYKAP